MAPCPFHQETRASFSISPDRGFFYCFGCQAKGDVIEFYKSINGLDFAEAVAQLADEAGIRLKKGGKSHSGMGKSRAVICREVNSWSRSFFLECIQSREGEQARNYLKKRLISPEVARDFALGWSPDGWDSLKNFLESKGVTPQQGVLAGVLGQGRQGRIYDRFRARLMFPIMTLSGTVIAFGGRVIEQGEPKYLNSSESPVYTKGEHLYGLYQARQNITRSRQSLLTEGYLDVLALQQHGFTNSCGVLGTALTSAQVKRLAGLSREVVLLFDGDHAGQIAAFKSAAMILQAGLACRVLIFPEGEDAHSLLSSRGRDSLDKLVQNARDGLDFCVGMLKNYKSPGEIMSWVENFIIEIHDLSWKSYYIPRISQALGVSEKELREKFIRKTSPGSHAYVRRLPGKAHEQRDRELLAFAVCFPEYRDRLRQKNLGLALCSDWARDFWDKLWSMQVDSLENLTPEESDFFVQSKMQGGLQQEDKEKILTQVEDFISRSLSRMSKKNLRLALARAQENEDPEEVRRILGLLQKSF